MEKRAGSEINERGYEGRQGTPSEKRDSGLRVSGWLSGVSRTSANIRFPSEQKGSKGFFDVKEGRFG